jgi:hypothetical protein
MLRAADSGHFQPYHVISAASHRKLSLFHLFDAALSCQADAPRPDALQPKYLLSPGRRSPSRHWTGNRLARPRISQAKVDRLKISLSNYNYSNNFWTISSKIRISHDRSEKTGVTVGISQSSTVGPMAFEERPPRAINIP